MHVEGKKRIYDEDLLAIYAGTHLFHSAGAVAIPDTGVLLAQSEQDVRQRWQALRSFRVANTFRLTRARNNVVLSVLRIQQ